MSSISLDVLAPIRQAILDAIDANPGGTLARLLPADDALAARPIYCGALDHDRRDHAALLFMRSGMADSFDSCIVHNYVRMLSFSGGTAMKEASDLADAAANVLRDLTRKLILGKLIHSVGIGADRNRLDPTTTRPYIETELTVVSDLRRYTT